MMTSASTLSRSLLVLLLLVALPSVCDAVDHYRTLGVPRNADLPEIRKAYRRLALELHPDKGGDPEAFMAIKEAYETLSDPEKRQEYDSPPQPYRHGHRFSYDPNQRERERQFFHQRHYEYQASHTITIPPLVFLSIFGLVFAICYCSQPASAPPPPPPPSPPSSSSSSSSSAPPPLTLAERRVCAVLPRVPLYPGGSLGDKFTGYTVLLFIPPTQKTDWELLRVLHGALEGYMEDHRFRFYWVQPQGTGWSTSHVSHPNLPAPLFQLITHGTQPHLNPVLSAFRYRPNPDRIVYDTLNPDMDEVRPSDCEQWLNRFLDGQSRMAALPSEASQLLLARVV